MNNKTKYSEHILPRSLFCEEDAQQSSDQVDTSKETDTQIVTWNSDMLYKGPRVIYHGPKVFNRLYYLKRDQWNKCISEKVDLQFGSHTDGRILREVVRAIERWACLLIEEGKLDMAFLFWIDAVTTFKSTAALFFMSNDTELIYQLTKSQIKQIQKQLNKHSFESKPFIETAVSLICIEFAERKQKFAKADGLITQTLSQVKHLEPCEITAWVWQHKGINAWLTLEMPAFCGDPYKAFDRIVECYQVCRDQLLLGAETKGMFIKDEAAIALVNIIKATLMLPISCADKKGEKLYNYVKQFNPPFEKLTSASEALDKLELEATLLGDACHKNMCRLLRMIMQVRLVDFHKKERDFTAALKILDELWKEGESFSALSDMGLLETMTKLVQERKDTLSLYRALQNINSSHGPEQTYNGEPVETVENSSFSSQESGGSESQSSGM